MLANFILFLNSVMMCRAEMEGFIVGGERAEIEEFPHSTFFTTECVFPTGGMGHYVCGGSLVNQRIILTAAHCLYPCVAGTKTVVYMGDKNRNLGIKITGSGFVLHEKYFQITSSYDVALLKLKREVTFSDKIKRVAIMKHPPYDEPARLAGWGLIDEVNELGALILRKLDQKIWKLEACRKTLNQMPKGTLCASGKTAKQFAARGDSGSGLIVRGYIQIGVVSYKTPSKANNIVVYSDVGYYYDWITFNVHKLYCFKSVQS